MANKKHDDLPQVLVLKRKYIQRFPNGQQVALYHSEHLNQFITVPLDNSQFTNTTESVLDNLNLISTTNNIETLVFEDNSTLDIDKECADTILEYLEKNIDLYPNVSSSDKSFLSLLEEAINCKSELELIENSDIMESDETIMEILPE